MLVTNLPKLTKKSLFPQFELISPPSWWKIFMGQILTPTRKMYNKKVKDKRDI